MKKILISACMLGMNCRYNGEVKANDDAIRLLDREDLILIPVCPEQLGGLATPRLPSEILGERVINSSGEDVTRQYMSGARDAAALAELYGCTAALLKERSPSCGSGVIYDGTFTGTKIEGDGMTVRELKKHGMPVFGESRIEDLLAYLDL